MTSIQRAGHSNWIIGAIAALSIVALIASGVIGIMERSDQRDTINKLASDSSAHYAREAAIISALRDELSCISQWSAEYRTRDQKARTLSDDRVDPLFNALGDAARGRQAEALKEFRLAQEADRRYRNYTARHPVPGLRLSCKLVLPTRPPTSQPSRTVRPSAGATATVTATRTVTRPGPTVTVSVRPDGTTTTVTRTATTTQTITEPPGKGRRSRKP